MRTTYASIPALMLFLLLGACGGGGGSNGSELATLAALATAGTSTAGSGGTVALVLRGQIYTSDDSAASWTAHESPRVWLNVASSADGSKLVALVVEGQIYTSTATTLLGTGGSISGASADAIELQYVGNGMFTALSHQGSLTIQ
jgi:hypothetical protein